MSSLIVVDRSGREHVLVLQAGRTMMELIRDNGLDELLALCGSCLSCATCHVHVDPEFLDSLGPMSDDENDLLDSSCGFRVDRAHHSEEFPPGIPI